LDLEAFDRNAADLLRRAGGKPVRLASKSVRCRALTERALGAGMRGVLAFTLPEALWLAAKDPDGEPPVSEDVVVGYPTADRAAQEVGRVAVEGVEVDHGEGRLQGGGRACQRLPPGPSARVPRFG